MGDFTHGGRKPTGLDAVEYAREVVALGAGEILLTSMDRDGTKSGFDLALTRAVADAVEVPVIASGGVGTLDHLVAGVRDGGRDGGAGGLDLPLRRVHDRPGEASRLAAAGVAVRLDGIGVRGHRCASRRRQVAVAIASSRSVVESGRAYLADRRGSVKANVPISRKRRAQRPGDDDKTISSLPIAGRTTTNGARS